MSKSVPDQKVEDVLSSVRRLVSSELPRKPRPAVPEGPGALVLTDAHRVASGGKTKGKGHSLEQRIAELEAAVGGQGDEFEPDGSEDQAQHRPDRIVYTRPPELDGDAAMRKNSVRLSQIALIETGPANDDDDAGSDDGQAAAPEFRRESQPRPTVEEAPMAEDVPLAPPASAEVRAFTDPDDVVRNIEARIASGRPISEPLPLTEPVVPAPDAPADETDDFDAALSQAVAASVSSSEGEQEGEGAADDDHTGDVLAADEFDASVFDEDALDPTVTASEMLADPEDKGEDAAEKTADVVEEQPVAESAAAPEVVETSDVIEAPEAAPEVEPAPEAAPDGPEAPPATGEAIAALAALPDEEAMRLLISRMIRDELQGDLGERITRNVRKLVRREIKRALTSKDLS